MNVETQQTLYAAVGSLVFALVVYRLGRSGRLSFRYTVGWLALAALGMVGGLFLPMTGSLATQLHLVPAAILGIIGIVLLIALCVQLSISISGLQDQVRQLAEEVALARIEFEERFKKNDTPT